jgi:signal transduction histidine kinase/DNA-binding response OmpR family regulator
MKNLSPEQPRRVLVIDDNRAIHEDFRKILSPTTPAAAALAATELALFGKPTHSLREVQFTVDSAYQGQEGVELVKKAAQEGLPYALAFVDIRMPPGWDGVETTQKISAFDPDVQIVLCTAYSDYSWDEMFEKLGHRDGLLILKKPFDAVEALQMAHALTRKWGLHQESLRKMEELENMVAARTSELRETNLTLQKEVLEHRLAKEQLQLQTAFLEAQVNSTIDGMLIVDQERRKSLQNQRFVDLLRLPPHLADEESDDAQLQWVADQTKSPKDFLKKVQQLYAHPAEVSNDEIELKNGSVLERYTAPVLGEDGRYYGRIWTFRDITARRRLEHQLFQSQKLETVGKLAGGIAHEFNSILTAILGQTELLIADLPMDSPLTENATEIRSAAHRAASLTRQLLAYGRKQMLRPETLDLNRILAGMGGIFQHLMGGDVDTRILPAPGLHAVKADAGQVEQVILNMAMNARDAMVNGGKLTLETANVSFDEESVGRYPELKPGDYVMLAITDTGTGMTPEVKARIFEPFFTTKDVGQGTGLGLSTCYGIIKQSGGHISVYSEPGQGATFKIYLPQVETQAKNSPPRPEAQGLPRGTETILLVEDETTLREMAAKLLRRLGYTVLVAANGVEALALKGQAGTGPVDLLFTDVVMPEMNGIELADRVRELYPNTRVLFTSAYTENAILHQGVLQEGVALLQKPFTPAALAHKLREVLDQPAPPRPDAAPP